MDKLIDFKNNKIIGEHPIKYLQILELRNKIWNNNKLSSFNTKNLIKNEVYHIYKKILNMNHIIKIKSFDIDNLLYISAIMYYSKEYDNEAKILKTIYDMIITYNNDEDLSNSMMEALLIINIKLNSKNQDKYRNYFTSACEHYINKKLSLCYSNPIIQIYKNSTESLYFFDESQSSLFTSKINYNLHDIIYNYVKQNTEYIGIYTKLLETDPNILENKYFSKIIYRLVKIDKILKLTDEQKDRFDNCYGKLIDDFSYTFNIPTAVVDMIYSY